MVSEVHNTRGDAHAPQVAQLGLTTDIPHGHVNVLVLHVLHVEADGGDALPAYIKAWLVQRRHASALRQHNVHLVSQLQAVQDGGLAGSIQAQL